MPERKITLMIDGDPTLLNKKIDQAAKNPVDLKITTDFDAKAVMSGLNDIKNVASNISNSIGKDFSKIFKGVGKDKTPMQDALNEVKANLASVITDIGTAENQLNAIRITPAGEGFEQLRINIDNIKSSIDSISKINLSALEPPDSAVQKLNTVKSQIESLSKVDTLESYLKRGANRYAKEGILNNSYYENMKKYVDMGGKLSDISHKQFGDLNNYLKEYTKNANAITSTGKSVSFLDNNQISGAVAQLRQLRTEEQALSQTSGGLNLLGNVKQMTDSIRQISALLHTQFNAEPIKVDIEPNVEGLESKLQSAVDGKKVQVEVEAKPTFMDQIDKMASKDAVTNIGINVGKAQDPIEKNRLYGQASRTAIKEMRQQVAEMEKELQKVGEKRYASADPTSAAWGIMSESGISSGSNLFEAITEAGRTDLSLSQQVSSLSNYMNLLSKTAEKVGADFSKFKTPQDYMKFINSSSSSSSIVDPNTLLKTLSGNVPVIPDDVSLEGLSSKIQSAIEGNPIKVPIEPNLEGFSEKIQTAVQGLKIDPSQISNGGSKKNGTDMGTKTKAEEGDGLGEGRGNMYRGQTALIRRQNVDLSRYDDQFAELGLGSFKRLATFGEDGDAIITFMSGMGEAATETTIRVEDLAETVGKLREGSFGHEDYKNEFSKADQDAINAYNKEQREMEQIVANQQKAERKNMLDTYKSGLTALATGNRIITPEEEKTISNVQAIYHDINKSNEDITSTQQQWIQDTAKISSDIYKGFASDQLKNMATPPNEEYLKNIEGYTEKRQEIINQATALKDSSIDFSTKEGMDYAQNMAESIRTARMELSGMADDYERIKAETVATTKEQQKQSKLDEKAEQARINALVKKYDDADKIEAKEDARRAREADAYYNQVEKEKQKEVDALVKKYDDADKKQALDRENLYKTLKSSDDKSDLSRYRSAMENRILGIQNNEEQEKSIDRVRDKVSDYTSDISKLNAEQAKYADSFRGINEGIYDKYTNKVNASYANMEKSPITDPEYLKKLEDLKYFRDEMNKPIDFSNDQQVENFRINLELAEQLTSELKEMNAEYEKQNKIAGQAAIKSQAQTAKQREKEISDAKKTAYEGYVGETEDEINKLFSGSKFDKFGFFNSAKVSKDGSAILTFTRQLDDGFQKVQVSVKSANEAINSFKKGSFETAYSDYKTGPITSSSSISKLSPEQKTDLEAYRTALMNTATGNSTDIDVSAISKVRAEYQAIVGDINNATSAQLKFKAEVEGMNTNIPKTLADQYQKTLNTADSKNLLTDGKTKVDELRVAVENLSSMNVDWNDENQIAQLQEQLSLVERLNSEVTTGLKSGSFTQASENSIAAAQQRLSTLKRYNSKAANSGKFRGEFSRLTGISDEMAFGKTSDADVKTFNKDVSLLTTNLQNAGKAGASFGEIWKQRMGSLAAYLTSFASFYRIVGIVKQLGNTVREVDTAMTELEKVSDVSGQRLQQSFETSKQTAQDLGATVTEVINATADWSRLGYTQDQAEELAKVAVIYEHVGDGINIDQANQSLISTLQGFNMEATDAMEIVDKFNEVANNEPIDSAGIGEALQRSAASFQAANTDLSESIALITGANSVVQDPSRVGNMWKTVSMRIRGKFVPIHGENCGPRCA